MEEVSRLLTGALLVAALALSGPGADGAEQSGVIAGSVFDRSGVSLPGAKVSVTPLAEGEESGRKPKVIRAVSDRRGEFAIRVPAGSMRYNVRVEADGFEPDEKQVQVEWDQHVDVFFRLRAKRGSAGGEQ